jgi:enamine deaminase RidA (YjgF/YER057c/UK114 family)
MTLYHNPFPADADRREIWDMLVRRDIGAFVAGDWSLTAPDFDEAAFFAVNGRASANPDTWRVTYASLDDYRDDWLAQSRSTMAEFVDVEASLVEATTLRDIDINGDRAVAHKKFDGYVHRPDGTRQTLNWQTLYHCRRIDARWRIVGFTGYLPHPMGNPTAADPSGAADAPQAGKRLTEASSRQPSPGPFSQALVVEPGRIVVISGQASTDDSGTVVGTDVAEQTRLTLENCRRQLDAAGATLADVFKVNVFLRDLADWPAFNGVYREVMPEPLPVRTTVGTDLLFTFLVEIEMWAVVR